MTNNKITIIVKNNGCGIPQKSNVSNRSTKFVNDEKKNVYPDGYYFNGFTGTCPT
jgi:hypothetical protein